MFSRRKILIVLVLLALAGGAFYFLLGRHRQRPPLNANVTQPALAVEALQGLDPKSLYYTFSAHDYLAQKKPALIAAHNAAQDLLDFSRAEQDAQFWRKLDRKYRFDTLLFCGDPAEYHNLLEHLTLTKDWSLVYLDHTSMIFRRAPAKPWNMDDLRALEQKFANYPPYDRAGFLTALAARLLAIGQNGVAKPLLDESLRLDKDSPETWTQSGLYELQSNKPMEGLKNVNHALGLDKNNFDALSAKAKILFATKQFSPALEVSGLLVQQVPDDPGVLFNHSKIAHEAHAYQQEIATLQHLIEIIAGQHQPVAGFQLYLGQAYAKRGDADKAMEQFQKALDEGSLSEEQQKFIKDTMATFRPSDEPTPQPQ